MEMTNGQQLNELFLSCGMGFLLGAYYDLFRVIRLVMRPGKRAIFFQDVFFFLSSAVVTFLFSLSVMDGELRFYLFLGLIAGFFAYYFTIGRVVVRSAKAVVAAFLKVWRLFWRAVFWPFRLVARLLRRPARFLQKILAFIPQKINDFLKKGLKRTTSLLYNHRKKSSDTSGFDREGNQKR